jgi:uncharacterized protein (TIGR02646 family)
MILLPVLALAPEAQGILHEYQSEVDGKPSYAEQVEAAATLFKARNKSSNKTFREVRAKLHEMCSGARRCCYCEDSCADEVEHIRPKNLYPEQVFVWENYVYACGPCNGPKNNRYAVFAKSDGNLLPIVRPKGAPLQPPPAGDHVLIDPRRENPLDFMELDLLGTFRFVPTANPGTREYHRAKYTIEVLHLNDRDILPDARRCAIGSYKARLHEYRNQKESGISVDDLKQLIQGIRRMPHPTVWAEIKRQRQLHAELAVLFDVVPEALDW